MPKDKTITHEKIYQVMKKEFLEKGFENVSMRYIGSEVGISQAALYRHYNSKEAMFDELVKPLIDEIKKRGKIHEKQSFEDIKNGVNPEEIFKSNNIKMFKELFATYHDEFHLLLCCSKGTKYENFIHNLVVLEQKEMIKAMLLVKDQGFPVKNITEDDLHLLLSAYDTALFEPIVHNWSKEKTLHSLDVLEEFFIPGWMKIMGFKEGK